MVSDLAVKIGCELCRAGTGLLAFTVVGLPREVSVPQSLPKLN